MSRHRYRRRFLTGSTLGYALGAITATLVLAGYLLGVRVLPVLSASMTPSIPTGALVITTPVTSDQLRQEDIITFTPPAPFTVAGQHKMLHRIEELHRDSGGWVITRGDANPEADPWRLPLRQHFSRVTLVLPYLGYPVMGGPWPLCAVAVGAAGFVFSAQSLRRAMSRTGAVAHSMVMPRSR